MRLLTGMCFLLLVAGGNVAVAVSSVEEKYKAVRTAEEARNFIKEYPDSEFVAELKNREYFLLVREEKFLVVEKPFLSSYKDYDYNRHGRENGFRRVDLWRGKNGAAQKMKHFFREHASIYEGGLLRDRVWESKEYDSSGDLLDTEIGVISFSYDKADRLIERFKRSRDGWSKTLYKYDEHGNRVSETTEFDIDWVTDYYFEYNEENQLISGEYRDEDNGFFGNMKAFYGEDGLKTREVVTYTPPSNVEASFFYDEHKNLIRKEVVTDSGADYFVNYIYRQQKVIFVD